MAKLIVGFSQKVGEANFGSRGASVALEFELDPSTAADAERTRVRISDMFQLARRAVANELVRNDGIAHEATAPSVNGHTNVSNGTLPPRSATPNQVRAIVGLAQRRQTDLHQLLHGRFGVNRVEDLSLKDASHLIDELKAPTLETNGR